MRRRAAARRRGAWRALAWAVAYRVVPRRAVTRHRDRYQALFTATDLPLYGLGATFEGRRELGGAAARWLRGRGVVSQRLQLRHRSGDGAEVLVSVLRRPQRPHRDLRAELASELWRAVAYHDRVPAPPPLQAWLAEREALLAAGIAPEWGHAEVLVDGVPLPVAVLTEKDHWIACGSLGAADLVVQGYRYPVEAVALVRLARLGPYLGDGAGSEATS